MLVFVLNKHGKPLMPCKPRKARKLLEEGKAKVVNNCPFTIKLLYGSSGYRQKVESSIVPSSSKIGISSRANNKCVYSAEIELRQDISMKMKRRKSYRTTRRNRKTRYRKCRFLNRKSDRRFNPTITSKIESHKREIRRVEKILSVSNWIILKNSIKKDYRGPKDLEWLNLQRQVFERDNFKCKHCKGKSKNYELHAHHVIHREHGGEDYIENIITLCKTCHVEYHRGKIILNIDKNVYKGKLDTELSIIRKNFNIENSIETYGFLVKSKRQNLNLEHNPINNACSILDVIPYNRFHIKNIAKGDYQQTKGIRSQMKIPTGKIMNVRKFDKIKCNNIICFVKGRMTTGYAKVMDIFNNSMKKLVKLKEVKILKRRSNSMVIEF
jgi:5-methylcytosine-specific restriction endonuclease McrA